VWSREWLATGGGQHLSLNDISGTEWPLFGCCFYLWATETLHDEYARAGRKDPLAYSRGAVDAAVALVLDPRSAAWVRTHWGDDRYLTHQDVFYRMLVMSAIISHHRLTGETTHLPFLREQVEGLAAELDASRSGLLDDYPAQCYPTDVVAAIAAIRKADAVLQTDHSAFVERALRGFTGKNETRLGLPPYAAEAVSGVPYDDSRGCGNAYVCLRAPLVWPAQASTWYARYVEHFWQDDWLAAGFREFPRGDPRRLYFDVDAGPVIHGLGFAASAFGLGASRTHGDFERVYPLTAMALAFSVPLADGTLLVPRLLSNGAEAPLLGETGLLYSLTRVPFEQATINPARTWNLPLAVWVILFVEFVFGGLLMWKGWGMLRAKRPAKAAAPAAS
jgi:hypothetical protein